MGATNWDNRSSSFKFHEDQNWFGRNKVTSWNWRQANYTDISSPWASHLWSQIKMPLIKNNKCLKKTENFCNWSDTIWSNLRQLLQTLLRPRAIEICFLKFPCCAVMENPLLTRYFHNFFIIGANFQFFNVNENVNISAKWSKNFMKSSAYVKISIWSWLLMFMGMHALPIKTCTN